MSAFVVDVEASSDLVVKGSKGYNRSYIRLEESAMADLPPIYHTIPVDSEEQRIDLMHAISAVVRKIKSPTGVDPFERYFTPEFTQQLMEYLHRAKRTAIATAEEFDRNNPPSSPQSPKGLSPCVLFLASSCFS